MRYRSRNEKIRRAPSNADAASTTRNNVAEHGKCTTFMKPTMVTQSQKDTQTPTPRVWLIRHAVDVATSVSLQAHQGV